VSRRDAGRVLLRSVAHDGWAMPSSEIDDAVRGADLAELPKLAAFHGVAGCVYHALRDNNLVQPDVSERLRATYHRAVATQLQIAADLRDVSAALDDLGVPWLVVKGPVLAETAYPRPDLRGYTDLDLVVQARELGRVLQALEDMGGTVLDTNWKLLTDELKGEVALRVGLGTSVDAHWHVVNEAEVRSAFALSMPQLFERAIRLSLSTCEVATTDRVDTLIHLALHSCMSGGNRLVWLKDLEQAIAEPFPWDEALSRADASKTGLVIASMLHAAQTVLGTSVPGGVIDALARSRTWPALVSMAASVVRVERTSGRRSPLRLVARSTRRDTRSSTATLARHGLFALRTPLAAWPASMNHGRVDQASQSAGSRGEFLEAIALERP
jgi:hypothetical protein